MIGIVVKIKMQWSLHNREVVVKKEKSNLIVNPYIKLIKENKTAKLTKHHQI